MRAELSGVFCALWTPLDRQGDLDRPALRANLSWVLRQGVHGLMALGSTADFLHLTLAQRKQVLEEICAAANGRAVMANISDVRLHTVIDLGRHAKSAGAQFISILPPWFYPCDEPDLVEFFVRAAEAIGLPLALYNFPEVTGKTLSLDLVRAVGARVPLAAFKQSGADFDYHGPVGELARQRGFALMTGCETRLAEAMALGATGAVSGLSNALADVFCDWHGKIVAGTDDAPLRALGTQAGHLMGTLPFTLNVRAAMEARGLRTGELKWPLSAATETRYRQLVAECRTFFEKAQLAPMG